MNRVFSLYDVEEFIKEAGAEKVTEDAVLDLEKRLEKLAEAIADRAKVYAEHAGRRKLIRKDDIMLISSAAYSSANTFRRSASATNAASSRQR